jgi:hypothetical protein
MAEDGVEFYAKTGLPKVANPKRKAECRKSLEKFALTYCGHVFPIKMSKGQKEDLKVMQRVILRGGRFAFAAPRGDGKTTRTDVALTWALLYDFRKFCVIVGSDLEAAKEILESIKIELRTNEMLRADFPLPCWAAFKGEDTALRCKSLHWKQHELAMEWSKARMTLPVIDGADGSGATIVPRGITGRVRGIRLKIAGVPTRPDLFAVDDAQTDESALSESQCTSREKLVLGAVMGAGGPGEVTACMMPCTIIAPNDLSFRFLDHERHPDWGGRTRGMIKAWPKARKTLWREYMRLRKEQPPNDETGEDTARDYYIQNREAMDKGAAMDWNDRKTENDISALQHAFNLYCDLGEQVFLAEYQNTPPSENASVYDITPDLIQTKVHAGRKKNQVPENAKIITAFTDINYYGLHWAAIAMDNKQTGYVINYGVHAGRDGSALVPKNSTEAIAKQLIYNSLVKHGKEIADLRLMRSGKPVHVGLWVIDGGYMHDIVQRYLEHHGRSLGVPVMVSRGYHADRYRPSGRGTIGRPREGCHYTESHFGKFLAFNQHYWLEVSQRAWLGEVGAPGSLSLFDGQNHREFAEQICREKLVEKFNGKAGPVWKYHTAPGKHDYGDAVYGCYVAAAWAGIGTGVVATGEINRHTKQKRYKETRKVKR